MDDFERMEEELNKKMPKLEIEKGNSNIGVTVPTRNEPVEVSEAQKQLAELDLETQMEVRNFVDSIDITDSRIAVEYGKQSQDKLDNFAENILNQVITKDSGEVGELITNVINQLNACKVEKKRGIFGLVTRGKNYVSSTKIKYSSVSDNVEKVKAKLASHEEVLTMDLETLDALYEQNKEYFYEMHLHIVAGKLAIEKANETAAYLYEKAQRSGTEEDTQEYNDYIASINKFDKKIHDLELTKMISLQLAPQIRMLQNTDTEIITKIQSTITNTIPLWKTQFIIFLSQENSKKALESQKLVTDTTNRMLLENAKNLKMISVESAKELERGIVDVETLEKTHQLLIETLDEVNKIQIKGYQQRRDSEAKILKLENELKQTLLSNRTYINGTDTNDRPMIKTNRHNFNLYRK